MGLMGNGSLHSANYQPESDIQIWRTRYGENR